MPRSLPLLALALLLSSPALSQDIAFVCDSANDAVYRLVDFDFDGVIDPTAEVSLFYDDASTGPDLSTPSHLHAYQDGLLLSDSGTLDAILFLRDLNGDGDGNDDGEVTPFYDDSSSGPDLSTPNGIAIGGDGEVFVADDGAGVKSIFRLIDTNDDGDALDDGEVTIFYDPTALGSGPSEDPESITIAGSGEVYVGDSTLGQVFRLADLNGDGDALDDGEAVLFYDGSGVPLGDIDSIQIDDDGVVYAVDENDGTIVRLEDSDSSGVIESSESTVYLAGSSITDPNDARLIGSGTFLIADGAEDALYIVEDLDGDGTAFGVDEVRTYFDDAGALLATPSGIEFVGSPPTPSAPLIVSLSTASGTTAGGTLVDISGSGLSGVTEVLFGGLPATSFTVQTDASIQAVTPPADQAGVVDVAVESPAGVGTLISGFWYLTPFLRGDANADGGVAISDAVVVLATLLGSMSPICPSSLDANDDGALEISDAVYLLSYLFQFGPPPPAPFPGEGIDPTPDALPCE